MPPKRKSKKSSKGKKRSSRPMKVSEMMDCPLKRGMEQLYDPKTGKCVLVEYDQKRTSPLAKLSEQVSSISEETIVMLETAMEAAYAIELKTNNRSARSTLKKTIKDLKALAVKYKRAELRASTIIASSATTRAELSEAKRLKSAVVNAGKIVANVVFEGEDLLKIPSEDVPMIRRTANRYYKSIGRAQASVARTDDIAATVLKIVLGTLGAGALIGLGTLAVKKLLEKKQSQDQPQPQPQQQPQPRSVFPTTSVPTVGTQINTSEREKQRLQQLLSELSTESLPTEPTSAVGPVDPATIQTTAGQYYDSEDDNVSIRSTISVPEQDIEPLTVPEAIVEPETVVQEEGKPAVPETIVVEPEEESESVVPEAVVESEAAVIQEEESVVPEEEEDLRQVTEIKKEEPVVDPEPGLLARGVFGLGGLAATGARAVGGGLLALVTTSAEDIIKKNLEQKQIQKEEINNALKELVKDYDRFKNIYTHILAELNNDALNINIELNNIKTGVESINEKIKSISEQNQDMSEDVDQIMKMKQELNDLSKKLKTAEEEIDRTNQDEIDEFNNSVIDFNALKKDFQLQKKVTADRYNALAQRKGSMSEQAAKLNAKSINLQIRIEDFRNKKTQLQDTIKSIIESADEIDNKIKEEQEKFSTIDTEQLVSADTLDVINKDLVSVFESLSAIDIAADDMDSLVINDDFEQIQKTVPTSLPAERDSDPISYDKIFSNHYGIVPRITRQTPPDEIEKIRELENLRDEYKKAFETSILNDTQNDLVNELENVLFSLESTVQLGVEPSVPIPPIDTQESLEKARSFLQELIGVLESTKDPEDQQPIQQPDSSFEVVSPQPPAPADEDVNIIDLDNLKNQIENIKPKTVSAAVIEFIDRNNNTQSTIQKALSPMKKNINNKILFRKETLPILSSVLNMFEQFIDTADGSNTTKNTNINNINRMREKIQEVSSN